MESVLLVLLSLTPDENQTAKPVPGLEVLRRCPRRGRIELDRSDLFWSNDLVELGAGRPLPVQPHHRLAVANAKRVAADGGIVLDTDPGNSSEEIACVRGPPTSNVLAIEKPPKRGAVLSPLVKLAETPLRISGDGNALQLSRRRQQDDLD